VSQRALFPEVFLAMNAKSAAVFLAPSAAQQAARRGAATALLLLPTIAPSPRGGLE